jgi:hypothetical protein
MLDGKLSSLYQVKYADIFTVRRMLLEILKKSLMLCRMARLHLRE